MAIQNRAALLTKTVKTLRKHYSPAPLQSDRTLFEHLLFACCLENSTAAAAEQVYVALEQQFFDWNEVRVSTVRELAEVMRPLSDPEDSARRLKRVLQSIFESVYAFELEALKKQNIGQSVKVLQNYDGTTPFAISYVVQAALAGHSIPVNEGAMRALMVVGVVTEAEAGKGRVPGLERALPKSKGIECGSLLHQWGVDFRCRPYAPATRKLLLEIAPDCKDRLPKRPVRKAARAKATPREAPAVKPAPAKKAGKGKPTPGKQKPTSGKKKAAPKKKTSGRQAQAKKRATAGQRGTPAETKKSRTKKLPVKRLSKRKPR